jgi:hypothetical protein
MREPAGANCFIYKDPLVSSLRCAIDELPEPLPPHELQTRVAVLRQRHWYTFQTLFQFYYQQQPIWANDGSQTAGRPLLSLLVASKLVL